MRGEKETLEQRIQRVVREEVAIAAYDPAWPEAFFAIDVLVCPQCGGTRKLIALLTDGVVVCLSRGRAKRSLGGSPSNAAAGSLGSAALAHRGPGLTSSRTSGSPPSLHRSRRHERRPNPRSPSMRRCRSVKG